MLNGRRREEAEREDLFLGGSRVLLVVGSSCGT
jgi:hypothetical protein